MKIPIKNRMVNEKKVKFLSFRIFRFAENEKSTIFRLTKNVNNETTGPMLLQKKIRFYLPPKN